MSEPNMQILINGGFGKSEYFKAVRDVLMRDILIFGMGINESKLSGREIHTIVLDDFFRGPDWIDGYQIPYGRAYNEPMKQNGRSAAYLDHDKTKKHNRRR